MSANSAAQADTLRAATGLPRVAAIDSLRGIAFLLVLLIHAGQFTDGLSDPLLRWSAYGMYGVQLFYVISAATLCWSLERRRDVRPTAAFLIRRLFRIAPLFWVALGFYLAYVGMGPRYWAPFGITPVHVVASAVFLNGWLPESINSVIPGGWSVAVETNFYLLVPVLFARIRSVGAAVAFWFVALLAGGTLNLFMTPVVQAHFPAPYGYLTSAFLYLWLPSQLPVFASGFVLYHVMRARASRVSSRVALLLILVGIFIAYSHPSGAFLPAHVTASAGFLLLAWGLMARPLPLVVNTLTKALGKVSYSAYLLHYAILEACAAVLGRFVQLPPAAFLVLLYGMTLACTAAVATLTYRTIERPGIRWGERIISRLRLDAPFAEVTLTQSAAARSEANGRIMERDAVPV